MAGKRIVITGATGLIGSRLVRKLAERGDRVTALVRDTERARRQAPGAAEYLAWSSGNVSAEVAAALDGADGVINLAGATVGTRWSEKQKRAIHDSRILGTRGIIEAMGRAKQPPRALINASAVGYYGTSESKIFTEDSPAGSDFLARTCIAWEEEARKAEKLGVRVVLVRTGVVLDPKGGALAKMLPPFKMFVGGPMASGNQWMSWIHIDDEIEIFLWALGNEQATGPVNAAAPEPLTSRDFSALLGKVLHRPSFFKVPKFVLDLILGEGSLILTEGQRVAPERTEKLGYRFLHPRAEEAMRDLLTT